MLTAGTLTDKARAGPGRPATGATGGDLVAFALAGAQAWNISHHWFLMHPRPAFHYLP